jgi:hypothetical protein
MKEMCLTLTTEKLKAECIQEAIRAETGQIFMFILVVAFLMALLVWAFSKE